MKKIVFADELEVFKSRNSTYFDANVIFTSVVSGMLELASKFEPNESDGYRTEWVKFWIEFPNRSWDEYASVNEIDSRYYDEDDIADAKSDYLYQFPPDESSWYDVAIIEDRVVFTDTIFTPPSDKYEPKGQIPNELCDTLLDRISAALKDIAADPKAYNQHINEHLPLKYRKGRIQRKAIWQIYPIWRKNFFTHAHPEAIEWFLNYSPASLNPIPATAGAFFEICKVAYIANEAELKDSAWRTLPKVFSEIDPKELYRLFADGRDDGLLDLDPDSREEFSCWKPQGGHPYEIFRGGNPTHISLYPRRNDDRTCTFELTSGQLITSRAIEAINAYNALINAGYPVELAHHDKLIDVVNGDDYMGIVPHDVLPRRCGYMFPDEDKVNSYVNLSSLYDDEEIVDDKEVLKHIQWYLEPQVNLKHN